MNKLTLVQTRGNVDLNNYPVEDVSDNIVTQLFNIGVDDDLNRTLTEGVDTSSVKRPIISVQGSISVQAAYSNQLEYLQDKYPNLKIASRTEYIWFDDPYIRDVMLNRVTHAGEGITTAECLAVTNMKSWFLNNQNIYHFDEFKYFKNLSNTEDAFANSTLKTINLSEITKIDGGFCTNSSLEGDLNIPKLSGYLGNSAFKNTKITSVSNLGNVTQIGTNAFMSSILLQSVRFPQSLTQIRTSAFEGCSSLEEVIGLENVKNFQGDVFYGITGLAEGFKDSQGNNLCSQSYVSGNANQTSPGGANFSGIEIIMRGVFYGTGLYGYINLPDCIKISGFANNPLITYINAPNAMFEYASDGAYNRAFWNCTGLVGVTLAPNQTRINSQAFDGCSSLTTLDFQGGSLQTVTTFEGACFQSCSSLNITNSDIQNAVTIGNEAFRGGVYKYSSLTLSHLTSIGKRAFFGNSALETVDLSGSTITSMESGVFGDCNITSITIPNTVTRWGQPQNSDPFTAKENSNLTVRGLENVTQIEAGITIKNGTIINPICLYYVQQSEQSMLTVNCNVANNNTYAKQYYLPSFIKSNRTAFEDYWGRPNATFFTYRLKDDYQYRLRVNVLYFKDIQEIQPFMFFGCYPKNLVINNTQPPSFGQVPTNSLNQSDVSTNYAAWSTQMFGTIPTSGVDAMTIYVPDSAISAYQANSHFNSYTIAGISTLTKYTDEAAWVTAGSPDDCLIEAYMAPPSNNS